MIESTTSEKTSNLLTVRSSPTNLIPKASCNSWKSAKRSLGCNPYLGCSNFSLYNSTGILTPILVSKISETFFLHHCDPFMYNPHFKNYIFTSKKRLCCSSCKSCFSAFFSSYKSAILFLSSIRSCRRFFSALRSSILSLPTASS